MTDSFPAGSLPTGGFFQNDAEAIYQGLLAMGLSSIAAAGVAGNIYQESHGNPGSSSGAGGGLFGETLANGGTVGGGSLAQQLQALASYIAKNGSIADVNANAATPAAAATYFSDKYERPGVPAIQNRIDAAEWVYAAALSGNWGTSSGSGGGGPSLDSFIGIAGFAQALDSAMQMFLVLSKPQTWFRIIAAVAGIGLASFAVYTLYEAAK